MDKGVLLSAGQERFYLISACDCVLGVAQGTQRELVRVTKLMRLAGLETGDWLALRGIDSNFGGFINGIGYYRTEGRCN